MNSSESSAKQRLHFLKKRQYFKGVCKIFKNLKDHTKMNKIKCTIVLIHFYSEIEKLEIENKELKEKLRNMDAK